MIDAHKVDLTKVEEPIMKFKNKGILHRSNLKKPITFGQFIDHLVELKKKFWFLVDTPIAYSHDDEGNQIQYVIQLPTIQYSTIPAKYWEYIDPDTELADQGTGHRFICIN